MRRTIFAVGGLLLLFAGCDGGTPGGITAAVVPSPAVAVTMAAPQRGLTVGLPQPDPNRFLNARENGWQVVTETPVTTFALSSDTTSYTFAKRLLRSGGLPPTQSVRVEDFLNAFAYDYPAPTDPASPVKPWLSIQPSPWNADRRLLHVGLRTFAPPRGDRPDLNLVLLIDVSGSMQPTDRLALLQPGFKRMLPELRAGDRVSLVSYANTVDIRLDGIPGTERARIEQALAVLVAGGGTAGGPALATAYGVAKKNQRPGMANRVVLATDGDFNIGPATPAALEMLIATERRSGIYLTAIGVGIGNLDDRTLQAVARAGNGIALYAGDLEDLTRGLVDDFAANAIPVADDVKVQVEFNPAQVAQYRLIGHETRLLRREDITNDAVDAGEIGPGRSITALFEFVPANAERMPIPPPRYAPRSSSSDRPNEIGFLRIAYRIPGQSRSEVLTRPIIGTDVRERFEDASADARFAAAAAGFALRLRRSPEMPASYGDLATIADAARGRDRDGRRAEFVNLVRLAAQLER